MTEQKIVLKNLDITDEFVTKVQARAQAKLELFRPQQLTDPRFMSASQKRAHAAGEEIWV